MKICFISPWFSEGMGYSENFFPKAFAELGHEVHLVTSDAQIYFNSPSYMETYSKHLGPPVLSCGVKRIEGFTVHRLPREEVKRSFIRPFALYGLGISGLFEYLESLKPDIIQVFNIDELPSYESARYARKYNKRFFTECHLHESVLKENGRFNLRTRIQYLINRFRKTLKFINDTSVFCYPIGPDVAHVAHEYLRVPKEKLKIQSLGVDTALFSPIHSAREEYERGELRNKLGFGEKDIVSIYTGRFSRSKSPQILAEAIKHLQAKQMPFKGLFVGNGTPDEIAYISSTPGCVVHPFVLVHELPKFYRAADIGVWPREESTSQLDAVACGLPIILSNQVKVVDRVDGNGLLFQEQNPEDLAEKIASLADIRIREKMSKAGAEKIHKLYSWDAIAKARFSDYANA